MKKIFYGIIAKDKKLNWNFTGEVYGTKSFAEDKVWQYTEGILKPNEFMRVIKLEITKVYK